MQSKDHKLLARMLASDWSCELPASYRAAFIFGNTEPDKNPCTYLRGVRADRKPRGHNYSNILPIMRRLFDELSETDRWNIMSYYKFGKLMHYIADSFTFPHNSIFEGSLAEHCRYEVRLHDEMKLRIGGGSFTMWESDLGSENEAGSESKVSSKNEAGSVGKGRSEDTSGLEDETSSEIRFSINKFSDIEDFHDKYLKEAGDCAADCEYILRAACAVSDYVARRMWEHCGLPAYMADSWLSWEEAFVMSQAAVSEAIMSDIVNREAVMGGTVMHGAAVSGEVGA